MTRRALLAYAAAMIVAGMAWGWRAPLGWDEQVYYVPAARFFAEALPRVPLDYPMPMPPLALAMQGVVYRFTGSVAILRMLSTAAMIGAVAVFATMLGNSRRDALLLVMFGTFPASLMNAFTLKHHTFVLLCCTGALALRQRQRVGLAAVLLCAAVLTHQIAAAMIATLFVLSLLERRKRDALVIALSALPLAALVVWWRGARPPMHGAAFPAEPVMSGLHPAQILVLLFMAGVWIAPAVGARWKLAGVVLPAAAALVHVAGLMRSEAEVFARLAGPVSSLISAAAAHRYVAAVIVAGALVALGAALDFDRRVDLAVWSAMYALVMLPVPYFFESYYALFVGIAWILLRKALAERPVWFPLAATLAGVGYVIAKA